MITRIAIDGMAVILHMPILIHAIIIHFYILIVEFPGSQNGLTIGK